jgi:hypothetical protein
VAKRFVNENEGNMHETGFWPVGHPGEPVPTVSVADFKSVWAIYQDIESRHPRGTVGVDISIIEPACSLGADIRAVTYRCGMLQILEMSRGDLLTPWRQSGQFHEAVFKVAATIPMKWMEIGVPQAGLPFDVDAFFLAVRKESP